MGGIKDGGGIKNGGGGNTERHGWSLGTVPLPPEAVVQSIGPRARVRALCKGTGVVQGSDTCARLALLGKAPVLVQGPCARPQPSCKALVQSPSPRARP